ncbi:MAG: HmuY family protein [Spirochaetaceae bacterium]|jgi:hypothetical protein|nr:HmuY family protein [Spirochaetaceae bacterium]
MRYRKRRSFLFGLAALVCATALFLGCPTEVGGGGDGFVVKVSSGQTKYYSLKTGTELTASGSTAWDMAFEKEDVSLVFLGPRIYTNGGNTAVEKGSGGGGGVWYTDKTDFASVTLADKTAAGEYSGLTTDAKKYVSSQYHIDAGTAVPAYTNMNVMTYLGYVGGDGSGTNPYKANYPFTNPSAYSPYEYNKKQFYKIEAVAKPFLVTNQVYIIKHGDGVGYSKVQITGFEFGDQDVYRVKCQRLD